MTMAGEVWEMWRRVAFQHFSGELNGLGLCHEHTGKVRFAGPRRAGNNQGRRRPVWKFIQPRDRIRITGCDQKVVTPQRRTRVQIKAELAGNASGAHDGSERLSP